VLSNCTGVDLTPQQEGSLTSLCYNIGCGAFGSSTLVKLLNNGDPVGAANEFSRWVYAKGIQLPGLVARREQEASVFSEGLANV
jgi:lysozyme